MAPPPALSLVLLPVSTASPTTVRARLVIVGDRAAILLLLTTITAPTLPYWYSYSHSYYHPWLLLLVLFLFLSSVGDIWKQRICICFVNVSHQLRSVETRWSQTYPQRDSILAMHDMCFAMPDSHITLHCPAFCRNALHSHVHSMRTCVAYATSTHIMFIPDIYYIYTTCITHSSIHACVPHTHTYNSFIFHSTPRIIITREIRGHMISDDQTHHHTIWHKRMAQQTGQTRAILNRAASKRASHISYMPTLHDVPHDCTTVPCTTHSALPQPALHVAFAWLMALLHWWECTASFSSPGEKSRTDFPL